MWCFISAGITTAVQRGNEGIGQPYLPASLSQEGILLSTTFAACLGGRMYPYEEQPCGVFACTNKCEQSYHV